MSRHFLELKIPPPLVGLAMAALMWWIASMTPPLDTPRVMRIASAIVIAAIGGALDIAGLIAFLRSKTTVNPLKPQKTSALVTGGVYRITRNPMYVGMVLLLVAWAVFLAAPLALAGPLLFFGWITRFQILPEERVMAGKFGTAFEDYKRRVRRWL